MTEASLVGMERQQAVAAEKLSQLERSTEKVEKKVNELEKRMGVAEQTSARMESKLDMLLAFQEQIAQKNSISISNEQRVGTAEDSFKREPTQNKKSNALTAAWATAIVTLTGAIGTVIASLAGVFR